MFDGQAGYLDHALASPTLVGQVTGATDWHINSDESDVVDYDTSFKPTEQEALYEANPYRSSDHDPVIVGLDLLNFDFSGFLSPVDNPPVVNTVNAGRTIPMKFTLSGDLGLDVLFETPTATTYACSSGAPMDEVESTTTSGGSGPHLRQRDRRVHLRLEHASALGRPVPDVHRHALTTAPIGPRTSSSGRDRQLGPRGADPRAAVARASISEC